MAEVPKLSAKQLRTVAEATGRVNLWEGAIRSGKTIGSILRFAMYVAGVLPRSGELVIVGRTRDSAWRNVIAPMQDPNLFGDVATQVVGNHGAPTVSILGRRVFVLGASDAKAERVLRGLTVLGAYVDEVTVIPEEFFVQLLGRMSPPGAKLFGTTNPDGPRHWLKTGYLDRLDSLPDWRRFHFTIDDNPSLTPEYVDSIKREYTGVWHKRFIQGLWVAAEGAIYDMWDDGRHAVAHADIPPLQAVLSLGIDYGTTNDTRGELLALGEDNRLYLIDEWAPKSMTDAGFSRSLREWMAGRTEPDWIFCDPAAASFKRQLWEDGFTNLANANNDVVPGIQTVASLLATDNLRVSERCTELIREIPGYMWDAKATEKGQDAPVKAADHALDAARYAIHSTRATWSRFITMTSIDDEEAAA